MKNAIVTTTVASVTGFVCLGLGYVAADGTPDVETERVEVPGPTKTVEVPGPTVTETVEAIPAKVRQSCMYAMDRAEKMGDLSAQFADAAAKYLPLIEEAYALGAGISDPQPVLDQMATINSEIQEINRRVTKTAGQYNRAASACQFGLE